MKNAVYYILLAIILIAIYLLIFNPFTKKVNTRPMLPDYKVLVLFPGSITDQSWNQNGHLAFRRISEERGIDIQSLASVRIDDIDTLMVRYAAKKNLFVIGFGGEFTHALESVALKYPNIKFASWGKHPGNGRNLGSLCERTEVYYLAGAMAAMKSKSETVASIIGQELPHTKEQAHSFELGARSINPNIRVLKAWVGVWESVPLARKTAHELIENGADVLYVSCDEATKAVHSYAQDKEVMTIGTVTDDRNSFPDTVIASAQSNIYSTLNHAIELFLQGKWEGKMHAFGLAEGSTRLELNQSSFTPVQIKTFERLYGELIQGKINIPGHGE